MINPINNQTVKLIAEMITDDPDIITEAPMFGGRSNKIMHGGSGTYEAEEVNLTPQLPPTDPRSIMGAVTYQYKVNVSGHHRPATYEEPEEHPEMEIYDVKVTNLIPIDHNGDEIQAAPEQLAMWKQIAEQYFETSLIRRVEEHEWEQTGSAADFHGDEEYDRRKDDSYDSIPGAPSRADFIHPMNRHHM